MPDAQCIRRLVCDVDWPKAHEVTTVTPESPGIPRAMALRLISCPPRRSGFLATVASGLKAHRARLGRLCLRRLDASVEASGQHDFAVRSTRLRQGFAGQARLRQKASPDMASSSARRSIAHGLVRTRPAPTCTPDAAASTASRPAFATIMIRPSEWDGTQWIYWR